MGCLQWRRTEKPKHTLYSVLLGQKARQEPKYVGVPSLRPHEQKNKDKDVYMLVKLIEAGRKESRASLPPLRHAGKEN